MQLFKLFCGFFFFNIIGNAHGFPTEFSLIQCEDTTVLIYLFWGTSQLLLAMLTHNP